ncbi:EFR1 family ferrodoxin [Chloroflexota bacterium]
MKLTILYFSGTGNTDFVARYLAGTLVDLPVEIELRAMEQQPAAAVDGFDLLAVGFPVYACDAPGFFQAYLEGLAPGEGRGAFVFCTKGAMAGNAVRRSLQRLADQGYTPMGGGSVAMPGSDGLAFIGKDSRMARSALQKDYDHLQAADRLADRLAEVVSGLAAGQPVERFENPLPLTTAGVILDPAWAYVYHRFGGYMRGRFRADARCTSCGLCERICTSGNISLHDGHPRFADRCVLCMRCVHTCPVEAIQIGRFTVDRFRWHGPKGDFDPLRLWPAGDKKE